MMAIDEFHESAPSVSRGVSSTVSGQDVQNCIFEAKWPKTLQALSGKKIRQQ